MKILLVLGIASLAAIAASEQVNYQSPVYKSDDGILEVTLTVDLVTSLNDTRVAPGYNGLPVGPTLRVSPGDTLKVTLVNNLASTEIDRELREYVLDPESDYANRTIVYNRLSEIGNVYSPAYGFWGLNFANLHFHGLENIPSKEALNTYVADGNSKVYELKIPEDQEPGLFWYHNHVHGATVYSYLSGLMGAIIVEGTDNDITKAPGLENATEMVLVFSEYLPSPEGNSMPIFPIVYAFNWEAITNGKLPEETVYQFAQGETVLFRAVSANVDPDQNFAVPGMNFTIVAIDGLPVPEPMEVEVVKIPAGGRVDFVGHFDTPGTFNITRLGWGDHFAPNDEFCQLAFGGPYPCVSHSIDKPQGIIEVSPDDDAVTEHDPIVLPGYSDRLKCLEEREISDKKTFTFEQKAGFPLFQIPYDGPFVPPGVAFGVNGYLGTPTNVTETVKADSCEEWHVEFLPPVGHPFHTHAGKFYLLAENGVPVEEVIWRDTYSTFSSNIDIKICWDRIPAGEMVMVHCHAATHIDIGMFTMIETVENLDAVKCGVVDDGDDTSGSTSQTLKLAFALVAAAVALFV